MRTTLGDGSRLGPVERLTTALGGHVRGLLVVVVVLSVLVVAGAGYLAWQLFRTHETWNRVVTESGEIDWITSGQPVFEALVLDAVAKRAEDDPRHQQVLGVLGGGLARVQREVAALWHQEGAGPSARAPLPAGTGHGPVAGLTDQELLALLNDPQLLETKEAPFFGLAICQADAGCSGAGPWPRAGSSLDLETCGGRLDPVASDSPADPVGSAMAEAQVPKSRLDPGTSPDSTPVLTTPVPTTPALTTPVPTTPALTTPVLTTPTPSGPRRVTGDSGSGGRLGRSDDQGTMTHRGPAVSPAAAAARRSAPGRAAGSPGSRPPRRCGPPGPPSAPGRRSRSGRGGPGRTRGGRCGRARRRP